MSDFSVSPSMPGAAPGTQQLLNKILCNRVWVARYSLPKMHLLAAWSIPQDVPALPRLLAPERPLLQPSLICQVRPSRCAEMLGWANYGGSCPWLLHPSSCRTHSVSSAFRGIPLGMRTAGGSIHRSISKLKIQHLPWKPGLATPPASPRTSEIPSWWGEPLTGCLQHMRDL